MDPYYHSYPGRFVPTFGFQGEIGLKNAGDKQGSRILTATSCYKQRLPLNLSDWEQTGSVLQCWELHYKVYFHPIVCRKPIFLPIFYLFSLNRSQCGPGAHQRSRDARSIQA